MSGPPGNLWAPPAHAQVMRISLVFLLLAAPSCTQRTIVDAAGFDSFGGSGAETETETEPDAGSSESSTTDASWGAPHVIFVNFEGPTLTPGIDDSRSNTSSVASFATNLTEVAPYGAPETIPGVMDLLREAWRPANVVFTSTRPGGGNYTMAVVTPTHAFDPEAQGSAVLDCGNENPNSVAVVFSEGPEGPRSPEEVARATSRQLGFCFGLDEIDNADDFMAAGFTPGRAFVDGCSPVQAAAACPDSGLCPPGSRNSLAQLVQVTHED